ACGLRPGQRAAADAGLRRRPRLFERGGQWPVRDARTGAPDWWQPGAGVIAQRHRARDPGAFACHRAAVAGGGPGAERGMIRVLLAEDQAMVRGALSALLSLEDDIEVLGTAP